MSEEQFPTYESPPVDTSPRPFGEIPGLWLKVTQMTEEFMAQEASRASGTTVLISVVILAVVSAILSAISSLIWGAIQTAFSGPALRFREAVRDLEGERNLWGGIAGLTLSMGLFTFFF